MLWAVHRQACLSGSPQQPGQPAASVMPWTNRAGAEWCCHGSSPFANAASIPTSKSSWTSQHLQPWETNVCSPWDIYLNFGSSAEQEASEPWPIPAADLIVHKAHPLPFLGTYSSTLRISSCPLIAPQKTSFLLLTPSPQYFSVNFSYHEIRKTLIVTWGRYCFCPGKMPMVI